MLFPFDLLPPDYDSQSPPRGNRSATSAAPTRRESPPALDRLANMFGLSVATFRRRMAQERTSLLTGIDWSGLNFSIADFQQSRKRNDSAMDRI